MCLLPKMCDNAYLLATNLDKMPRVILKTVASTFFRSSLLSTLACIEHVNRP